MGDKVQFASLEAKDRGNVTFEDNSKGKIMGIGKISNPETLSIHHVLFVDWKHNNMDRIHEEYKHDNGLRLKERSKQNGDGQ